jgi:ferric-chelate reductase
MSSNRDGRNGSSTSTTTPTTAPGRNGPSTTPTPTPTPTTATGSAPAVPQRPLDDAQFVFATTVFVLGCFALFAVLTWPRLLTRFSRGSEWTRGHFIYHSTKPLRRLPSLKRRPTISRPLESRHEKGRVPNSEDNHTTFSHVGLVRREGTRHGKVSLPPHCRSWSGIYQKTAAFLGIQLEEGLSLGRCIILLSYAAIVLFTSLYKSDPFSDYLRTGYVATAQIPIVFALAAKNGIIGRFLSMGYEKVGLFPFSELRRPVSSSCRISPAQLSPPVRRHACCHRCQCTCHRI